MITHIGLKNFKLHSETKIDATNLTVFIGPNNSGKSSIFQSMLLWRQAAARGDARLCGGTVQRLPAGEGQPYSFAPEQIIDTGEFNQVLRRGEREILISVTGTMKSKRRLEYGPGPTEGEFEVRVRENALVYQAGRLAYKIESLGNRGEARWDFTMGVGRPRSAPPLALRDVGATIEFQPSENFRLLDSAVVTYPARALTPEKNIALNELSQALVESPRRLLESIHAVYPLRGFEEAGYPLAEPAENLDRMALPDRTIALLSVLAYNRPIEQRLSSWLEELVGIGIETKLLPGKRVTILASPSKAGKEGSLFSSEGTGANQLPFILVPIGLTPVGETVFLSEPEVHLHPRAQVGLARLLINLANKERRQFFIETHSEHVLHALLHAVAEGSLSKEDLTIFYFENEHGEAACRELSVDSAGGVEGGLPGFFDQSLGELAEYLEALKRK